MGCGYIDNAFHISYVVPIVLTLLYCYSLSPVEGNGMHESESICYVLIQIATFLCGYVLPQGKGVLTQSLCT